MKNPLIAIFIMAIFSLSQAHEGGHHHQTTGSGKYGGVLTKVFPVSGDNHSAKPKAVYNAEIVKDEEGKIFVYFYDKKMKLIKLDKFSNKANGMVKTGRGRKITKVPFLLNKNDTAFTGNIPKVKR
ncbi:MAG: hypothetical protein OXB84_06110, partial [Halobacteriovoraceae bacterium]|nr:hypothetical protein [Halobacteriovoraceae bacterium]